MTFTQALALSLLVHLVMLVSLGSRPENQSFISKNLGFETGRIIIKSILTSEPIKKVVAPLPFEKASPVKPKSTKKALPLQKQKPVQSSIVKSFDESIIKNTPPPYPRVARKRGWQGSVELLIKVSATGKVSSVNILKSNAHEVLTKSAVASAMGWLFNPSTDKLPYQVKKLVVYKLK